MLVLFVFTPWTGLAPDANAGSPLRVLSQLGTAITFPRLYVDTLRGVLGDGYVGIVLEFAVVGGLVGAVMAIVNFPLSPALFPAREYAVASGGKGDLENNQDEF